MANNNNVATVSVEDFVLSAIVNLRDLTKGYRGIHTVYTGFNGAFRRQFPDLDVVETTKALAERGVIEISGARGGAMLYLPGEAPDRDDNARVDATLDKILAGAAKGVNPAYAASRKPSAVTTRRITK